MVMSVEVKAKRAAVRQARNMWETMSGINQPTLEVGDVLIDTFASSCQFYKVNRVLKATVAIIEIVSVRTYDDPHGQGSYTKVPLVDDIGCHTEDEDESKIRKAVKDRVSVGHGRWAEKWNGKPFDGCDPG
jgi:hypothetical protein